MPAPTPRRAPVERELHGHATTDPYAWMRDDARCDPEVLAHLRAENGYVDEFLAPSVELRDELFEEIRARILETDLSVPEHRDGHWYYTRTVEGQQYPIHCRIRAGDETDPPAVGDDPAGEAVLLDENLEAGDGDHFEIGVFDVSPDHGTLAWAFDRDGSERYTLRFRDLGTGEDRRRDDGEIDEITEVTYGSAWSADGEVFFYVRPDAANRPFEVWRHRLGTRPDEDVLVHHEPDERYFCSIAESADRLWLFLEVGSKITREVSVLSTAAPTEPFRMVAPRREGVEVEIEHLAGTFYLLTNDGALDFRVVSVPVADAERGPRSWVDVLAHEPGVRRESVDVQCGHLLVEERTEATTRVRVIDTASGDAWFLDQPEDASTVVLTGSPDVDWPQVRYLYTSLVTPRTVIDVDLRSRERHVRKVQPVLGGYDPADLVSRRCWATAEDGTRIPVSLVHRADREVPGPTLLYGYGAYEISSDPAFSILRLSLLERGWAFAIAHVRGGGEMGRQWYLDGKYEAKSNSFDDLIACGRMLVDSGVSAPDRLAVRGGSAGGLLVGAALNRAPELWSAVVAEVPFVDVVNTMLDPDLPLTVTEYEEWGNPTEASDAYQTMVGYSPYENIPAAALPPVLATGGLHDPRVGYWEPAKWVARLRDDATGGPFLLRTELGAGHGGPSGRYDAWKDEAMVFAFLLQVLGEGQHR